MSSSNCPNCSAPLDPSKLACPYCGSYVIWDKTNGKNFDRETFLSSSKPKSYKGIYLYGRLLDCDEYPVRIGLSNLYRGILNAAGGHLILTNKRFMFCSHGFNLWQEPSEDEKDIYLEDIESVDKKVKAFISKQLIINGKGNLSRTFIVYGLDDWYEAARKAMNGEFIPLPNFNTNEENIEELSQPKIPKVESSENYIEELKQLKQLLDAGIITEEEFAIKKRFILKI